MSYGQDYSLEYGHSAAEAMAEERAAFVRRTYGHLAGAILAFIGVEYLLFQVPGLPEAALRLMWGSHINWILTLLAFMGVGWIANAWASSQTSRGVQYLGLGLYVVAQAVLFLPLICVASYYTGDPTLVPSAGILTLALFGGLTATVFVTRKDFSFLAPALTVGSCIAIGVIVAAILFDFPLGLLFIVPMIALISGYIIYYTSNVLHHYHTEQHVAASLALFSSVALMFWYIILLLLELSGRD